MGMESDLERIRQSFLAESEEDLAAVEQSLLRLEKVSSDGEALALVFRKFHTLKGNASSLGLDSLSDFAHRIEDLLQSLRAGQQPVTRDLITYLLRVVDAARTMVPAAASGQAGLSPACEDLLGQIKGGRLVPVAARAAGEAEPEPEAASETLRTLRIDLRKLDQLLSVTSELAIARGRLALLVEEQGTDEIATTYRAMEALLNDLHHFVINVRMVPLSPLLQHYARVVRDLALEERKEAELSVTDQGVEVDTSVIEQIRGPLTHMIRNAVCHGIETPSRRRKLGKPALGRIHLQARYEASGIVMVVEDDGSGLDRERVLERARALGLVAENATLSDQEIDRLIFRQGLSTAKDVSSTSGRGVGMDVVLRHLDALGGSVAVQSRPGQGTSFTIRMPLTLAMIEGLLVRAGEGTFVVPLAGVVRCVDLASALDPCVSDGVLSLEGQAVPFVRLRSIFGLRGSPAPASGQVVVIVQREGGLFGIAVDRLLGKAQIVVRPPGRFFKGLPALSGMTVLGDGQVAPILNVAGLLQQCSDGGPRPPLGASDPDPKRPVSADA